jgi:glycerol transport system permease protein
MSTAAVKEKKGLKWILQVIFVAVILVVVVFPIYYIASTSIRTNEELFAKGWSIIPQTFTLDSFKAMFTERQWTLGITNSIVISLANTALCLLVALPAAYVFTRATFRFDGQAFFFVIIQRMIPPGAFRVPIFMIYSAIGLYDTLLGVVVAHSIFNLPLASWILHGFMKDIPTTVDEAAFVDGHGMWGFWRRVFLPLMMPAIGITAFFLWMFSWTEVILAGAVTRNTAFPVTVQLLVTSGTIYTGVGYANAAACGVVSMIPGLAVLYFVRHQIARGFMLGGRV